MCFTNILVKNKWISEFHRTNPLELKCWSTFCVNYFLRYYLMMQHQPIVKSVNGTNEWAHRPSISSLSLLLVQTQAARWKAATPEQLAGAHLYLDIAKSGCLFHAVGNVMAVAWCCMIDWPLKIEKKMAWQKKCLIKLSLNLVGHILYQIYHRPSASWPQRAWKA